MSEGKGRGGIRFQFWSPRRKQSMYNSVAAAWPDTGKKKLYGRQHEPSDAPGGSALIVRTTKVLKISMD